jgi:hypothetical protein
MLENLMIYGAVYEHVFAALADLENFEKLNDRQAAGPLDAAVIDVRDGLPRLVRRIERPTLELIPELVARGRPPIGVLAEPLAPGESALAVIARPTVEKAFTRAVRRAVMTSERPLDPAEVGAITQSA